MASEKAQNYGNQSISALKGADRVRKRPGVIFGSDGLEGCEHAVFEILSNSIDEAREGHGRLITVTRFLDHSVEVEDQGRGCPVDWNEKEQRYNWELVFCELYAGGKYGNNEGENYEYSLGLNGLGSCATQYASEYMDVTVWRDGFEYQLHFKKGQITGKKGQELEKTPLTRRRTGTRTRWLPDLEVFTDINIPPEYFAGVMKRQAVVNAGVTFRLRVETGAGKFETTEFLYDNGISDYVRELAGEGTLTDPVFWETEKRGRDRADKDEYKVRLSAAFCFSNRTAVIEHYHNSSWLEHGGSPEKAAKSAFVGAIDGWLRQNNKYQKSESRITWGDIEDCLVLVSSNFSTQTSYENQTKKAITNKFVQDAMAEFLRGRLEIYFIENPSDALRIAEQVLINKRSREQAEKARLNVKKKLGKMSKGMLSMITIIVALCSKAPYTFLDEPVAGLDVVAREQFYKLLLEEYASSGRTFVVSTHIIEEAADVLEEVIILHEGKILIEADTQAFVDSAVHVSGKIEEVDAATAGLEVHHPETVGRSKGVTVFLKPGQHVDGSRDVSVQPVSLQRAFVALCGEEETRQ